MNDSVYENKMNFFEKKIALISKSYEDSGINMWSSDYKERFLAEKAQLEMRYWKLKRMVFMWDNGGLDFEPTCSRNIYDLQLKAMEEYLSVLCLRYTIEFDNDEE